MNYLNGSDVTLRTLLTTPTNRAEQFAGRTLLRKRFAASVASNSLAAVRLSAAL